MKNLILSLQVLILFGISSSLLAEVQLSERVFREVPFSSQYSEDGALIRSVDFRSVNNLIPQLEEKYKKLLKGRKLADRNEAHITVITPPEGKTGFFPNSIGIDKVFPTLEMIQSYKPIIQNKKFSISCVGMQKNTKGNVVFYLVIESKDILDIRKEISKLVLERGGVDIPFKPLQNYYPHITIGYAGGDVHGVSKGTDTCVEKVILSKD
jgi:2'-5' RNA ligase